MDNNSMNLIGSLKKEWSYVKEHNLDMIINTAAGLAVGAALTQEMTHPIDAIIPITLAYGGMINFVLNPKTTINYAINMAYFALGYYAGTTL